MPTQKKTSSRKAVQAKAPEALFVLGMHRTGTSALTRCMSLLGYQLPKTLMGANKSNQKGHWESTRLARLNDRILDYFGMEWSSWLPLDISRLPAETKTQFINEIITIIQGEYDDGQPIVIKDPRISRLLPLYIPALKKAGYSPKFILASRNPLEVASSLKARNDIDSTESHMLWLRYNLDAEIATRKLTRSFIDFGYLLSAPHDYLASVIKSAKLAPPYALKDVRPAIDNFLDSSQRHDSRSLEDVMLDDEHRDWIGTIYQAWLAMCANASSKASLKSFDNVRTEFDTAAPQLFRQLSARRAEQSESQRQWDKAHDKMTSDIEILRQTITELKGAAQQKDVENSGLVREQKQTQKELKKAFEDIEILQQKLSDKNDVLTEHQEVIAKKETEKTAIREDLKQSRSKLSDTQNKLTEVSNEAKTLRSDKRQLNREKWALQDRARFASDMVTALQQSTSWKATKPLRFVKRLFSSQTSVPPIATPPITSHLDSDVMPASLPSTPIVVTPTKPAGASDMAKVEASGLFDPVFYVSTYPDVQSQALEPLAHYLNIGWQKGYNPSEKFNTAAYLVAHPELKARSDNPLLHYINTAQPNKISTADRAAIGRVAVFMAVAGPYDDIKDPDVVSENADYFIFTDQEVPPNSVWQKREFEYFDADPTRMARFIKTHPHLYFGDYDWALWMDANLQINVLPEDLIVPIKDRSILATWMHPLRSCIFDEAKECEKRSKDDGGVMQTQMGRYKDAGYPAQNGLFETSVMASKMNDPAIAAVMNGWWAEIEKGSRRDQLSLPYVVRQNKVDVAAIAPQGICMRSDPRFNYYRHQK